MSEFSKVIFFFFFFLEQFHDHCRNDWNVIYIYKVETSEMVGVW